MIVNYCDSKTTLSQFIDYRFRDALKYIADNIMNSVNDMKEIQGDINTLLDSDRSKLKEKANNDYQKACEASEMENVNKEKAIRLWGEILGGDFPTYG